MKNYELIETSIRGIKGIKDVKSINDRLDFIRCVLGYSVHDFSKKLGVSKQTINNNLGKKGIEPTLRLIDNICTIFPVNRDWVFVGKGEPFLRSIKEYIYKKRESTIDSDLSDRIKSIRDDLGLSQSVFANSIGTTRDAISFIEVSRAAPPVALLKEIIRKYHIKSDWLLFGVGQKFSKLKS